MFMQFGFSAVLVLLGILLLSALRILRDWLSGWIGQNAAA